MKKQRPANLQGQATHAENFMPILRLQTHPEWFPSLTASCNVSTKFCCWTPFEPVAYPASFFAIPYRSASLVKIPWKHVCRDSAWLLMEGAIKLGHKWSSHQLRLPNYLMSTCAVFCLKPAAGDRRHAIFHVVNWTDWISTPTGQKTTRVWFFCHFPWFLTSKVVWTRRFLSGGSRCWPPRPEENGLIGGEHHSSIGIIRSSDDDLLKNQLDLPQKTSYIFLTPACTFQPFSSLFGGCNDFGLESKGATAPWDKAGSILCNFMESWSPYNYQIHVAGPMEIVLLSSWWRRTKKNHKNYNSSAEKKKKTMKMNTLSTILENEILIRIMTRTVKTIIKIRIVILFKDKLHPKKQRRK